MVQKTREPLDVEVIKVTIKDKPGRQATGEADDAVLSPEEASRERLRRGFEVLRLHALRERRVRELRRLLEAQGSGRRLRRCFQGWRELASRNRKQQPGQPDDPGEAKIQLLVSAIAERQRRVSPPEPPVAKPRPTSGRTASKTRVEKPVQCRRARRPAKPERREQLQQLRELDEAARKTSKRTIEVAKQALGQCEQRTRRGIIHLMREQGCRDNFVVEMPRIPSPPRFLMQMEARAEARKRRIKEAEEARRRRREEQKKREEASRLEEEERQRQMQINAEKEAKRARREQELKRLKEVERNRQMEQLADRCYRRYLFRRYFLKPFGQIVEETRQVFQTARRHYEETLLCKIFSAWKREWMEQLDGKIQLAGKFYRHNLLWYAFDEWRTLAFTMRQKYQVAQGFYTVKLEKKCIDKWHSLCVKIKVIMHEQEIRAKKHYEKRLKKVCFATWKRYMLIASDINETEQRREEWRDLIKKFSPNTPKLRRASLKF